LVYIQFMDKLLDNQIIFYKFNNDSIKIEVLYSEDNVWLSQKQISELFGTSPQNVTMHLRNIFNDGELEQGATCKNFLQVGSEGGRKVRRNVKIYSLEAILAVGYRVNSERGMQFRQWATEILKKYIAKGYVLDSDRMKYGSRFSSRYFDELYEEIRDIRTSERLMYQKITDLYSTAIDYSPTAFETKSFFATVQNKLHFAITGQTAAEIISSRVNSRKKYMGLTSWRKSPFGKIMPSDVLIAKNYLNKNELSNLNRIVNMYLDYAEIQAVKRNALTMKDWIVKLNAFLKFNENEILEGLGKISHEVAKTLALNEYQKYRIYQDKNYISDFDREVAKLK